MCGMELLTNTGATPMVHNMSLMHHVMPMTGHGMHMNHSMSAHDHVKNMSSNHGMNGHGMSTHGHMNNMSTNHGMNHHDAHGGGLNHNRHVGGHAMFFSFLLPVNVLFFEWKIENDAQLVWSCLGIFILAVLYEGLKVWRQYLLLKSKIGRTNSSDSEISGSIKFNKKQNSKLSRFCNGWHFLQSILHTIQTTLGMFLMLIYMTFNIWLAIIVSLGSGFGYFLFAWLIHVKPDFGDHCG